METLNLMWFSVVEGVEIRGVQVAALDVRSWLQADMPSSEIDFRLTPNSGHSEAHAGLPFLTHSGSGASDYVGK